MKLDEVIAHSPPIKELDDDRVQFYLQNRDVIETWASLRREAAAAITNGLLDLVEPLQDDLVRLGEHDVQVAVDESRGRHSVAITRLSWHRANLGSPVQVALETESQAISSLGAIQVYPCVRAKQGHPHAEEYRDRLNTMSQPMRAALGHEWKVSQPRFVVWKYIDTPQDSWDLEAIVLKAREDVLRLWSTAAPSIDALMAQGNPAAHA